MDIVADVDEDGIGVEEFVAIAFVVNAEDFDECLGVGLLWCGEGEEGDADDCEEQEFYERGFCFGHESVTFNIRLLW